MLVFLIIVGTVLVATLFASRCGEIKTWVSILSFAAGTFLSEAYYYLSWYLEFSGEATGAPGVTIALIEAGAISIIGAVTITVVCYFIYRIPKFK